MGALYGRSDQCSRRMLEIRPEDPRNDIIEILNLSFRLATRIAIIIKYVAQKRLDP